MNLQTDTRTPDAPPGSLHAVVMRLVRWLKHKLHRCAEDGCWHKGMDCYLPDGKPGVADEYVCWEHAHKAGYCRSCGCFNAGIESFDFGRSGLCESCEDQWKCDTGEYDEPDEYQCGPWDDA